MSEFCNNAGHTERCSPTCLKAEGCSVGRKHFTIGGVCCITCFDNCSMCYEPFYVESLLPLDSDDPAIDVYLCHCCTLFNVVV